MTYGSLAKKIVELTSTFSEKDGNDPYYLSDIDLTADVSIRYTQYRQPAGWWVSIRNTQDLQRAVERCKDRGYVMITSRVDRRRDKAERKDSRTTLNESDRECSSWTESGGAKAVVTNDAAGTKDRPATSVDTASKCARSNQRLKDPPCCDSHSPPDAIADSVVAPLVNERDSPNYSKLENVVPESIPSFTNEYVSSIQESTSPIGHDRESFDEETLPSVASDTSSDRTVPLDPLPRKVDAVPMKVGSLTGKHGRDNAIHEDTADGITHPRRKPCRLAVNEKKILGALYQLREIPNSNEGFPRKLVGHLSGYTNVSGGSFTAGLKTLRDTNRVRTSGGNIALTEDGAESYRSDGCKAPPVIRSNDDFHRLMKGLLNSRPCCDMFDILSSRGTMSREELAKATGYKVSSGGTFGMNLKNLENHLIVECPGRGLVRFTKLMFPFGNHTSNRKAGN